MYYAVILLAFRLLSRLRPASPGAEAQD